jgi:oxaloacetate decarboxylase alpha subunit
MARIELIDTTMRDGNQSLWGATGLTNAMVLQIAPVVDAVGFRALDFITSTHMGVAVRYHKENPWERIRLFHAAAPRTPLGFLTSGLRFVSWEKASSGLLRLAFGRLVQNGISRFQVIDPMNDMDALLAVARLAREQGGREIVAGLTYTLSPIHDDSFFERCAARLVGSLWVDRVYLKDPGGLLTPERTRTLVPAIRARIGTLPLEIHSHCSLGLAPFTYLAGAEAGIDAMHVAVSPAANGSSQPAAERMVANLRALGHTVEVDDASLARMSDYFRALVAAENLPLGQPQEFDAASFQHQVPGGMLTTMRRQLKEINQLEKFPAVLEEVALVRRELGYPIMVTPFSQVVAAQSVMNVISKERYANVPDEVIRYVLGKFGSPPMSVDADVRDRIMNLPRARGLAEEPEMPDVPELRRRFGAHISDEELVLRAVMPGEHVDAMLAAGPSRVSYHPSSSAPLRLIRELTKRRDLSYVSISKGDFHLELRSSR